MSAPKPAKPATKSTQPTPAALAARLRVLLFCAASNTDGQKAGIARPTVQLSIVESLIERDGRTSRLRLTERGRAVMAELLSG